MTSPSVNVWGIVLAGGDGARLMPLTRYIDARLTRIGAFAGGAHEAWALEQAYALMRTANIARDVLERSAASLLVLPVRGVLWSDWGTLERVVRTLRRMGTTTQWLTGWVARPTGTDPGAASIELARG